ncbi:glucose-1-phosphate cytidylyltransferase [Candidatus Micrarchaeota archaeon CG10_big_fil_rev_8_21_14_0_10_45_29]|nr:MAG: glucose-1-phosphate cytidylyltransferase [Candidatus Micrarchaeota archaeon CG10_big_fil_rev_8_21_14_0_10_45_29]
MQIEKNWPVVILCGGQGTRLREETEYKPKPMVNVGGQPILMHIMRTYAKFGFKRFILCLGYRGDMIKQYFHVREMMDNDVTINLSDRSKDKVHKSTAGEDWEITFVETGLNAQTGSRIKKIEKYIDTDHFLATYGDGVADIDIEKLAQFHLSEGRMATLTGVRPPSRFGLMEIEGSKVVKFKEKPLINEHINGGFYVFSKKVFEHLKAEDNFVLEKDALPSIAQKGELSIHKHDGFWHMMDTYKDYLDLNKMWDSGNAKWKV